MSLKIESVASDDLVALLKKNELEINSVGHFSSVRGKEESFDWINFRAPMGCRELQVFCLNVVSFLPRDGWRLLHFNPENGFQKIEEYQFNRLMHGPGVKFGLPTPKSIVMIDDSNVFKPYADLVFSDMISAILSNEGHAEIVSENSIASEYFGIQDGFIYMYSSPERVGEFSDFMETWRVAPSTLPNWVLDLMT